MWIVEYVWRRLTDRKVHCRRCGAFIGYVGRVGHQNWLCPTCGHGIKDQPVAV